MNGILCMIVVKIVMQLLKQRLIHLLEDVKIYKYQVVLHILEILPFPVSQE